MGVLFKSESQTNCQNEIKNQFLIKAVKQDWFSPVSTVDKRFDINLGYFTLVLHTRETLNIYVTEGRFNGTGPLACLSLFPVLLC